MSSVLGIKVIGVTVAVLSKQHGGTTVIKTADNFKRLLPKSGNFLVCPISLESLLAVIQVGAKGDTAKEIAFGLKLPVNTQRLLETYLALYPLEQTDSHYRTKTFRKLFISKGYNLSSDYKDDTAKYFHADIENINLLPAPEGINSVSHWVQECTENNIKDELLNTNVLTQETRAVFGNIISFQGMWSSGFQKNVTEKRKFFIDTHHYIEIDMIDIVSKFNYYENDKIRAKFLDLSYENSDCTLNVVLPYDVTGLSAVEGSLHQVIRETKYHETIVNLRIPKLELKTMIPFNNILQHVVLGIVKAFQDNAEISLIGDTKEDKLRLDGVMQETFLKVEETGKDVINYNVAVFRDSPISLYKTLYINRPFLLFLRDKQKGISFMGRFLQPDGKILTGDYKEEEVNL